MRDGPVALKIGNEHVEGTLLTPDRLIPGILFVHGWGGCQEHDLDVARAIARLGCLCFTFDLRGHARSSRQRRSVTREDNLADLVAAYDFLAGQEAVDRQAIAVVGASYGAYLATILTTRRPVCWLGLRVPALYRDDNWDVPKEDLDREDLDAYRRSYLGPGDNVALDACAKFGGDVLLVESECDEVIPHPAIVSYLGAFRNVRSLTYRLMEGADHALTEPACQKLYNAMLTNWVTEMVLGAREGQQAGSFSPARP
ncbi:MAG: alpha/beta fold hydrolase [Pseudomonadota bacterium]|nr:alpha/beta fold hydrolase [Pseudomonadota bacterium]